jgi:hypothetical protein
MAIAQRAGGGAAMAATLADAIAQGVTGALEGRFGATWPAPRKQQ